MTTTDITIVSKAMGLLRANTISGFDDGSNEADIASLYYDDFAKDILTRYPWSFATKTRQLNQDATPPVNKYRYSHIVPAEVLRIWALFSSDSVGATPIADYDVVMADSGARRIHSNYATLFMQYTVYPDEDNWPSYFVGFAFHAFAALVAKTVTDQDDLAARLQMLAWGSPMENELGGKFGVACKVDAMQKPGIMIQSSPLVDARFS